MQHIHARNRALAGVQQQEHVKAPALQGFAHPSPPLAPVSPTVGPAGVHPDECDPGDFCHSHPVRALETLEIAEGTPLPPPRVFIADALGAGLLTLQLLPPNIVVEVLRYFEPPISCAGVLIQSAYVLSILTPGLAPSGSQTEPGRSGTFTMVYDEGIEIRSKSALDLKRVHCANFERVFRPNQFVPRAQKTLELCVLDTFADAQALVLCERCALVHYTRIHTVSKPGVCPNNLKQI